MQIFKTLRSTVVTAATIGAAFTSVGCEKTPAPAPEATQASGSIAEEGAAPASAGKADAPKPLKHTWPEAFDAFLDVDAIAKGVQGTWLFNTGAHVDAPMLVKITATDLTVFHDGKERTDPYVFETPLQLSVTHENQLHGQPILLDGDSLYLDGGVFGLKRGDQFIVHGRDYHVFDGKTCTQWNDEMGKWVSKPATCELGELDGKPSITVTNARGLSQTGLIVGDLVLADRVAERVGRRSDRDYAALKTEIEAARAPK